MKTHPPKIRFFKTKRFLLLFLLLSILAAFYWAILQKVSPKFKPPTENRPPIERDYRGVLNIKALIDYKHPADDKKEMINKNFGKNGK